ncbi:hypothetical protein BCV72DRAFT_3382 [Rhizopus microsporus var. microsporus]|uniref:Arrestin-like N-terminal domain-containing protein n=2 Tax=Rhizopus microsporus TaxID=58291 RepID=A0A2G4SFU5_RHIZD|nr:uncharacterized protein RHIMIDRAFT_316628 [Rhizopus microsporus ATCC 52813]ORE10830.1 hypothetical protein BCV72DRAFT_3382 [Rhizopus microsporus var. microsporus]PHZ07629.1 hypothetical protein RHIMIDRAFT_316628 [Rhizopus microsporus ATCC 52813]
MIASLIGTKDPTIQCDILFYPQYQNDHGQVVCYPGSVFEGVVKIKLQNSMPIHHIKLVFKAAERVNYDAMGWEKLTKTNDRLFAVRTILWGLPSNVNVPVDACPILEAGEHHFPFVCQMPVINFPPTFQHHLIATTFGMIVSIERPNSKPILSKPVPLQFQPIIETMPVKNLNGFKEQTKLTQQLSAQVLIPRLAYSIHEDHLSVPLTVQFLSQDETNLTGVSQLRAYIKCYYQISYKTFSRSEVTTVADYLQSKLPSNSLSIQLRIPDKDKLTPTLTYSRHLTVEYKLVITVKVRHGPLNIKKKLFEAPIIFGTLPPGTRAPRQLEAYSQIVDNTSALHSKPTFLRPEPVNEEEFLPAYDSEEIPPAYRSNIPSTINLPTTSIHG